VNLLTSLNPIASYIRKQGARPLPPSDSFEEMAPDIALDVYGCDAQLITSIDIEPNPSYCPIEIKYFIDGVQKTVAVAEIDVGNFSVPFVITHLIAGATMRQDRNLSPAIVRDIQVFLIPLQAMRAAGWTGTNPPGQELGYQGQIYRTITQTSGPFFSDISISMERRPRTLLEPSDLAAMGKIRRKALDRAKEILRILELGVLWELRTSNPEEWILLDGPVAPILKYSRLVDNCLLGLQNIANKNFTHNFLRRVIGAVKDVRIVPVRHLHLALQRGPTLSIPLFRFSDAIKQTDAVAQSILSAFVWLRRELIHQIPIVWSASSGLARIDIPFPCLVDVEEPWEMPDFMPDLSTNTGAGRMLRSLLTTMMAERWPVPESSPHRKLVEYFPIAETERWLSSMLLSAQELRAYAT